MFLKFFRALVLVLILFFVVALPWPTYAADTSCTKEARGFSSFSCAGSETGYICGTAPYLQCLEGSVPLGAHQELNCSASHCVACVSGYADCTDAGGCETSVSCTPNPPAPPTYVILNPSGVQGDSGSNPSIWINKTGAGDMLKFQGGDGLDKIIVNNSGQLIMGLGWTQTLSDNRQNLIYGGISSSSNAGNVLLFQKEPDLTLLQLDNAGNLTVGKNLIVRGLLQLKNSTPISDSAPIGSLYYDTTNSKIKVYNASGWGDIGGGATYTQGDYITIAGNVISAVHGVNKCFGPILRGVSATSDNGDAGGYRGANAQCAGERHVCTAQEILQSINCGVFASAGITNGTRLWVSNGAPSLPTPTNDCQGWTDDNNPETGWQGIVWEYGGAGGTFFAESCGVDHQFACCK